MKYKKILVVDDEQDLCEILLYNLTAAGYQAEAAYTGETAWEKIVNGKCFDLLILDVMMPGMTGFELAEKLKSNPKTSKLPIIFLTAKDAEDDTLQGFELGADDYITKPFSVREVVARVKAVLARSQSSTIKESIISFKGLVLDLSKKTTMVDGQSVSRTVRVSHATSWTSIFAPANLRCRVARGRSGERPHCGCEHHTYAEENRPLWQLHRQPPGIRIFV